MKKIFLIAILSLMFLFLSGCAQIKREISDIGKIPQVIKESGEKIQRGGQVYDFFYDIDEEGIANVEVHITQGGYEKGNAVFYKYSLVPKYTKPPYYNTHITNTTTESNVNYDVTTNVDIKDLEDVKFYYKNDSYILEGVLSYHVAPFTWWHGMKIVTQDNKFLSIANVCFNLPGKAIEHNGIESDPYICFTKFSENASFFVRSKKLPKEECISDSDCTEKELCINQKCEGIKCDCSYISERKCIPYECCKDEDCKTSCNLNLHKCYLPKCKENDDCKLNEVCHRGKCEEAKIILSFVPVNWEIPNMDFKESMEVFDVEADSEADFFIGASPLKECPERVRILKTHEICEYEPSENKCDDIQKIIECGKRSRLIGYIIGMSPIYTLNRTEKGHSCFLRTVYSEQKIKSAMYVEPGTFYPSLTAHELGHEFGLTDQYNKFINSEPNLLSKKYGCDPDSKDCCYEECGIDPPNICCYGNLGTETRTGRSIMSATLFSDSFDIPSYTHLKTIPELKCE